MKKFVTILLVCIGLLLFLYLISPYKIKTICFGDVCPQNGGTYIFYKTAYSKEECLNKGDKPITGFGWVEVYAGCSPSDSRQGWLVNYYRFLLKSGI
ncbi:MAG: hypothetical protein V4699_00890 [Patescibacteria group bacterium]